MVAVKLLEDSRINVGNAFLTAKICTNNPTVGAQDAPQTP